MLCEVGRLTRHGIRAAALRRDGSKSQRLDCASHVTPAACCVHQASSSEPRRLGRRGEKTWSGQVRGARMSRPFNWRVSIAISRSFCTTDALAISREARAAHMAINNAGRWAVAGAMAPGAGCGSDASSPQRHHRPVNGPGFSKRCLHQAPLGRAGVMPQRSG